MKLAAVFALALIGCVDPDGLEDEDYSSTESAINVDDFVLPKLSVDERTSIVHAYDQLDPTDEIPRGLLEDAIVYFDQNQAVIPRHEQLVVVDMSKHSGKNRLWIVDLATGAVEHHKVAHGDGSDTNNDGLATSFGNLDGSHKTSLGFYLTAEIYNGTHAHSMRLDGLSRSSADNNLANTNVRARSIVVHEASYVRDSSSAQQGRSNGCLALDPSIERRVVDRIHDGTLIYVATAALNAPVGRGDDPDPMDAPADAPGFEVGTSEVAVGGCSTGGGAGGWLIVGMSAGLFARRRRR